MRLATRPSTIIALCAALGCLAASATASAQCGNGAITTGEGCDDGNLVNGDGCSMSCTVESGFACVPTLFPTGVNDAGFPLTSGTADPHWTWSLTNVESTGVPGIARRHPAWTIFAPGQWVAPTANFGNELTMGANTYWFQRISIPAAFVGQVTFPIIVSCDNSCEVFVNGVSIGSHSTVTPPSFQTTSSIPIPTSAFVAGSNLITVRLFEQGPGTPRGLLVYPGTTGALGGYLSQCVRGCVTGAGCNDSNTCTTDVCTVTGCTNTSLPVDTSCSGGVCNGDTMAPACVACRDSAPTAQDSGCAMSAPHCRTSGTGAPVCESCVDTQMGSTADLGCGMGMPYCVPGSGGANTCVACVSGADCSDGNSCTNDTCTSGVCSNPPVSAGTTCAGGVCDGLASAMCEACIDSGSGTDTGCGGTTPHCIGASGSRSCVACVTNTHCNDNIACTVDTCGSTTANTCSNVAVAAGGTGNCTGGEVCSGSPTNLCVTCADTNASGTGTDAGCMMGMPFCEIDAGGRTCEACIDSGAATDFGCSAATPDCVVGAGGSNQCVECTSAAQCSDGNECTSDMCTAGACDNPPVAPLTPCSGGVCTPTLLCSMLDVVIDAPADGDTVGTLRPTISGTATPRATVVIIVADQAPQMVVADDDGNWSLNITTDLLDGLQVVTATVTVGPLMAMDMSMFTVDTMTAVAITDPADESTTMDTTPVIQGTGERRATVVVSIDGTEIGTAVVDDNGDWSLPELTDALMDGSYELTAVITDDTGNTATTTSEFTVDTMTMVAITDPADGGTTTDSMPLIRGTGEAGATVVVSIDGNEIDTVTVGPDGTWMLPVDTRLRNGMYELTAVATDAAGNTATATSDFTVNSNTDVFITAPVNDSVSNDRMPTIMGTGVPGASVLVTIETADGDEMVIGTTTVQPDGTWSIDVMAALADGNYFVMATATDLAGNVGSDTSAFTVDTATQVSIGNVEPTTGVITGTGEPGATVVVTVDGVQVGTVVVGMDGTWSVDGDALSAGDHSVVATATDAAGNTASATTTVNVMAPDGGMMLPDGGMMLPDAGTPGPNGGLGGLAGGSGCATHAPAGRGWPAVGGVLLVGLALATRRRRR